jgi:hypothetical protein
MVHTDSARLDTAAVSHRVPAQNTMVVAAHRPYSSDLASYDFYLFGHLNGLFRGGSFETGEHLLSTVEGILKSVNKSTLTRVFLEWVRRLE